MTGHTTNTRGFTFIELLVVLAVIGLISAVALPRFMQALPGVELKTAARGLAASLRTARSEAIRTSRNVTVMLESDGRVPTVGPGAIRWEPPDGIALESDGLSPNGGPARLSFFPDGSSDGGVITLSRGEGRYNVSVDWLTGGVGIRQR